MKKKVRKPRRLWYGFGRFSMAENFIFLAYKHCFNIKQAKILHAWLGKAIDYLESKEKNG